MELKEYQRRTLDLFTRWWNELRAEQLRSESIASALEQMGEEVPPEIRNYPKATWEKLSADAEVASGSESYVERTASAGFPIPHICFKVPTGGGKTLLGAAALERLHQSSGLVLWMVPSNAIYEQTKEKLWDQQHPYRQMLERGSGGSVRVLEKDDPLSAADLEHYFCVMLISLQSANRKNNREFLKLFRDTGRYTSFFPDVDDLLGDARLRSIYADLDPQDSDRPVTQSLYNVFKIQRPVVILDEAHKAYGRQGVDSEEFVESINRLNPTLVIELSATPSNRKSNLLVDISGKDLKAEEMIKLPVQVTSYTNADWHHTLGQAHAKLEEVDNQALSLYNNEGRYIRPIAVVRVERTGPNQRDGEHIHAEDVRAFLIQKLGVSAHAIAVQSSSSRELVGIDLLSELSQIRWIITKAALMEGWDCPFAYLLVMLDNTSASRAITQLVGRVMRQPDARTTGREALDQCYVYCQRTDVGDAVQFVKTGLERDGMGDLRDDVHTDQVLLFKTVEVKRRPNYRNVDIFLPRVLHRSTDGSWEELDYLRHIVPEVKLEGIGSPDLQSSQGNRPSETSAAVDLQGGGTSIKYYNSHTVSVDERVKISWYSRRISDIVPNPFQAARISQELIQCMYDAGHDDKSIYTQRTSLASQLREHVTKDMDRQAEEVFRAKVADGSIRFDLTTADQNYRVRDQFELLVSDSDALLQRYGQSVQLTLFEPTFDRDFNDLERRFAFYLDEQKALRWWHRIAVRQRGEYYLRGWRRERIWPDFVGMFGENHGQASVLVFETKGDQLAGNEDSEYKKRLFAALEVAFNAGTLTVHDGPAKGVFRLVFDREGFPEAEMALGELAGTYRI